MAYAWIPINTDRHGIAPVLLSSLTGSISQKCWPNGEVFCALAFSWLARHQTLGSRDPYPFKILTYLRELIIIFISFEEYSIYFTRINPENLYWIPGRNGIKEYIKFNEIQNLHSGEYITKKSNFKYWNSNYFTSWNTKFNLIALKLHNLYSTKKNSAQFRTNIFWRYWGKLTKLNIYSTSRNSKPALWNTK